MYSGWESKLGELEYFSRCVILTRRLCGMEELNRVLVIGCVCNRESKPFLRANSPDGEENVHRASSGVGGGIIIFMEPRATRNINQFELSARELQYASRDELMKS